jgi:hypothetical protein
MLSHREAAAALIRLLNPFDAANLYSAEPGAISIFRQCYHSSASELMDSTRQANAGHLPKN